MTTEPIDALMPCPFCGCRAVASINKGESLWSHDVVNWTRVHCTNDDCNAQTEATCEGYEPSAIEVWNRRTPQPVVREPLTPEQVTAAAKKLAECTGYTWDYMSYPGQAEMRKHAQAVVEAAHGIKGGQHG